MSDPKPVSEAEREAFARELTDEQLEITAAVEEPKAILAAGQPDFGKAIERRAARKHESRPCQLGRATVSLNDLLESTNIDAPLCPKARA